MKKIHLLICLFFGFFNCQKTEAPVVDPPIEENPSVKFEYLKRDNFHLKFSGNFIKNFLETATNETFDLKFEDVQSVKIVYETLDTQQKKILASGILLIPEKLEEGSLVSLQHGTITDENRAPSNSTIGINELTIAAIMASSGMFVIVPDYLGYGESKGINHPYEHRASLAQSSYDCIKAVYEYLDREALKSNEKLFLTGYSEGGYATMALHQLIEQDNEIKVTHAYPGAGAYSKTAFLKEVLKKDEILPFMTTYLWVLDVYNTLYKNLNRPWTNYLNEPYATNLENIQNINASIDSSLIHGNPQILFTDAFIRGVIEGTDTVFLKVLQDNDVYDWKPKAPITLFHGTKDDFVYPINSELAEVTLKNNGGNVVYERLKGLGHTEAAIPFYLTVWERILNYK